MILYFSAGTGLKQSKGINLDFEASECASDSRDDEAEAGTDTETDEEDLPSGEESDEEDRLRAHKKMKMMVRLNPTLRYSTIGHSIWCGYRSITALTRPRIKGLPQGRTAQNQRHGRRRSQSDKRI